MSSRVVRGVVMVALTVSVAACRSEAPPAATETAATPAAPESHEGHAAAKVTFAEPKDGATLSSKTLTKFVFKADNYQISPVPQGEVKDARAAMGHFHLGVDADCLATGTAIPKAEAGAKPGVAGSWIHFGSGTDNIEMSLTPGPHKFSVQVGDDLHRAVEGLCETITVTVE